MGFAVGVGVEGVMVVRWLRYLGGVIATSLWREVLQIDG